MVYHYTKMAEYIIRGRASVLRNSIIFTEVKKMKKAVKSLLSMLLVVTLLMSNFAMIFSFAAIEN